MNAPFAPVHLKLVLDNGLREAVRSLDEDAFDRFELAWGAAEHLLGRGAHLLSGSLDYLVPCAGIILAIRFDPRRERFVIVAFEDLGDSPDPDGGHRLAIDFAAAVLDIMGLDVNGGYDDDGAVPRTPGPLAPAAVFATGLVVPPTWLATSLAVPVFAPDLAASTDWLTLIHALHLRRDLGGFCLVIDGVAPSADP